MSAATAWTPGPWMVEPINGGEIYQITTSEDEDFLVIAETPEGGAESEANACLIAAAPEMYAALDKLLTALRSAVADMQAGGQAVDEYAQMALDRARTALARARGES